MSIILAVPKENKAGERRVALVPAVAKKLQSLGVTVHMQAGAGDGAFLADSAYDGVTIVSDANALYQNASVVFKIEAPAEAEIDAMQAGTILMCMLNPFNNKELIAKLRDKKITAFGMEMIPRISRAQSMDVLSSQASAAGYKGVLLAANLCSGFFPMMTTAAGTIKPSRVLVIGAGVAGLQAIATAKRLGAIVEAYDVRPETKEQIMSLGGRFVETGVHAVGEGGYARELTAEEKQKQADVLAKHIAKSDAVICTAGVPGRPAPRIVTKEMVSGMKAGAVVVDLLAESGGNCELTQAGETVHANGVLICGQTNLPSTLPIHTSEMFCKNLLNFFEPMVKEGAVALDWEDEVIAGTAVTHDGKIVNERIRQAVEGDA